MKISVSNVLVLSGGLFVASMSSAQALKWVDAPYLATQTANASASDKSMKAGLIDDAIGAKPAPKTQTAADGLKTAQSLATTSPIANASQPTTPGAAAQSTGLPSAPTSVGVATNPTPPTQPEPGSTKRTWHILPTDGRLATTFERWAKADGMKLVWDAQQHVNLSSSDSFTGTLTEALNRVLTSPAIRLSSYPLEACIYPNNPALLRITRVGDQSQECPQ